MSGHRNWHEISGSLEPEMKPDPRTTVAYVQGYILACEDILKDYEEMDPDMDDLDQLLASKVQESLDSARRTLEKLT